MNIPKVVLFCAVSLAVVMPTQAGNGLRRSQAEFRVVGYLPEYRAAEFDPIAARALTDLIVFSAAPTAAGGLDISRLKKMPWAELRAFKTRQRVRLLLCVGGWERSTHFAAVASSPDKRKEFVKACVRTCLEERLDGIDLDWEHPKTMAEQDAYGTLLADLHTGFEPHGLVLSVTIAAWQKLPKQAYTAVDWVQVMAYDHEGRHSTMEDAQKDVKTLRDAGVPAAKIIVGLPFYGRTVAKKQRTLTYREIVAKYEPKPDVDEVDGLYFNGPSTIRRKTEWSREARLGGVMVWELGQDARGDRSLLRVIRTAVDQLRK